MTSATQEHLPAGDSPTNIGWIGLEDQGAPMARAIAEAGFTLHVWARRPAMANSLGTLVLAAGAAVGAPVRRTTDPSR